jgi:hypothetical protein
VRASLYADYVHTVSRFISRVYLDLWLMLYDFAGRPVSRTRSFSPAPS